MKTLVDREDLVFSPPELGCVLHLPGLPGSGGKAYDRSCYGNHGTITGATWKRLPSGLWCLGFDGSDDVVSCGSRASLHCAAFTWECWVKLNGDGAGGAQYIVTLRAGDPDYNNPGFYAEGFGASYRYATRFNNLTPQISTTDSSYDTREWHHIVVTFDSGNNALRFYIDGEPDGSYTLTGTYNPAGTMYIGMCQSWYPVNGFIALVRSINRALGTLEIQHHFNREKRLFGV